MEVGEEIWESEGKGLKAVMGNEDFLEKVTFALNIEVCVRVCKVEKGLRWQDTV